MKENPPSPTLICPKCNGNMEPGKLTSGKFTSFLPDSEQSKVIGRALRVTAYRCQNCGYCEIYANGLLGLFDFG